MGLQNMIAVALGIGLTFTVACGTPQVADQATAPDRGESDLQLPPDLSPCEDANGLWGYCAADGAVVIAPEYIVANDFLDTGIAAVATDRGWFYIDKSGRVVMRPLVFDNGPDDFNENLARFETDGKIGFFDRTGAVVIEARFEWARPFCGGLAAVCSGCRPESDGEHQRMVGGLWGFVDRAGELVVPMIYEQVHDVSEGKARGRQAGEWTDITLPGSQVEPG